MASQLTPSLALSVAIAVIKTTKGIPAAQRKRLISELHNRLGAT